jgi:uncharacterized protein (TIGR02996 family)
VNDEEAMLAAIRENPADDTVRLAYADWLDEHGRGAQAARMRADIRVQQYVPGQRGFPGEKELASARVEFEEARRLFDPNSLVDESLRNVTPFRQCGCVYRIEVERAHWSSALQPALARHPIEYIDLNDGGDATAVLTISRGGFEANTTLHLAVVSDTPRELQPHEWGVECSAGNDEMLDPIVGKWPSRAGMVAGVTDWALARFEPPGGWGTG